VASRPVTNVQSRHSHLPPRSASSTRGDPHIGHGEAVSPPVHHVALQPWQYQRPDTGGVRW
jgi:hypothetical protein